MGMLRCADFADDGCSGRRSEQREDEQEQQAERRRQYAGHPARFWAWSQGADWAHGWAHGAVATPQIATRRGCGPSGVSTMTRRQHEPGP